MYEKPSAADAPFLVFSSKKTIIILSRALSLSVSLFCPWRLHIQKRRQTANISRRSVVRATWLKLRIRPYSKHLASNNPNIMSRSRFPMASPGTILISTVLHSFQATRTTVAERALLSAVVC